MKKSKITKTAVVFGLIIFSLVLFSSCGSAPKGVSVEGKTLNVSNDAEGNVGYFWTFEISDTNVLHYVARSFSATDEYQELTGSLGVQTFIFQGNKEGTAELKLQYFSLTEKKPLATRTLLVQTDKDGNIILVEEKDKLSELFDIFI